MTQITLTADQAELLRNAETTVFVCDPSGQVVATMKKSLKKSSFTPEEIAAAERAADQTTTWRTTAEVLERLKREMPINDQ